MASPDTLPNVTIIVLSYNSREHLAACFESLHALDYPAQQLELMLVDNASSDDSVAYVRQTFPTVTVIETGANLGFCGGNNAGAREARGEWIAILNPDMRVEPDWLQQMVRTARHSPDIACVGSRILSWDGQHIDFGGGSMNFYGIGMQDGWGRHDLDSFTADKDILFACGGAMLIRRDVFLDSGGFDEDYFSFFEDVDLGWRLWVLGHRVRYCGRAVVYHIHHGAWGKAPGSRRLMFYEQNALYTILKNYDDDNLARVWPAALMLLVERAYTTAGIDPGPYRPSYRFRTPDLLLNANHAAEADKNAAYYWREAMTTLQETGPLALLGKVRDELRYRWLQWRKQWARRRSGLRQPDSDTHATVPQATLSHLQALSQVHRNYEHFQQKRHQIQARRQRDDADIIPLFQQALVSHYPDSEYVRTVQIMSHIWDLNARFGATS